MTEQGKVHSTTFGKVPPELMHDSSITDGAVRLYAHMHWRYGQNQQNFEGQKSMAKYLNVSTATIRNRIEELESRDWVVTIHREFNRKTGNFSTPFYHVFVVQSECRDFRDTYILQEGEVLYEKPEPQERKSRKGVGGKSSNLPNHANLSSHGHENSSYSGGANSSSHYPESVYPDSNREERPPENPQSIPSKKNSSSSNQYVREDELITSWAAARKLPALAIGANVCTTSARKKAAEMLAWQVPATSDEIRLVTLDGMKRRADYPFEFVPSDLINHRAKQAKGKIITGVWAEDNPPELQRSGLSQEDRDKLIEEARKRREVSA